MSMLERLLQIELLQIKRFIDIYYVVQSIIKKAVFNRLFVFVY